MSAQIELSAADARTLTDRIRTGAEMLWELIKQAYASRAWAVLGYDTWDDYCTREFGTSRIKLPREDRQEVVSSMREIGMSTRAIASATGNSTRTITSDLRQVSQSTTPVPVTGTDGKTYKVPERTAPVTVEEEPESEMGHVSNATPAPGEPDDEAEAPTGEHVGTIRPADLPALKQDQPAPRAEPITHRFTSAVADLNKLLDRFHRIQNDPNFRANKNQVATLHSSDLARAISELETLADNLN